jgi:class 3 adenylate cyclase/tetratricopeptide (TPR) repeat protein
MRIRCTACGHDNPADVRACAACGVPLGAPCTQCGELLSPRARFCLQCGAPATPSFAPAPSGVPDGERRHLTVLFCDLVGSTALAERLDPEDWRDTVVRFQQAVIGVIEQAGGYVAQHLGDGLLVYFGYPRASEDATERALRCGLALVRTTRGLNPELRALYDLELSLRVGLHTGPVVVGEVGGTRRETLALGSTANVAARVQGAAEPDTVFVTETTLQRVAGLFVTEDRGEHALKGIERPMRLHAVKQPRERSERPRAGLTPFVDRREEFALVEATFARARQGQGQALVISGEAGMGKSRLVQAFRGRIEPQAHAWHECRAASYNRDSPLQPWLQLQRELFGIGGAGESDAKLRKLEAALSAMGFELAEAVPLLAALHGLPVRAPYALPALGPLGLRKKTLALMAEWVLRLAHEQSAIVLIEDLHWLDPSSTELIGLLLARISEAPLLLLLTHRPEFEPPWPAVAPVTQLALARLPSGEARSLVLGAAQDAKLSDDFIEAIVRRSDGVPLFAEEIARTVVSRSGEGADASADAIVPDTLEDSLMARLEQAEDVKELAQLASVLGREFPLSLLRGLWPRDAAAFGAALQRAERAQILLGLEGEEGPLYFFSHALIRDAVYNSLLRRTRRRHHAAVAQALRERFPEVVRKQPELLAHHLTEAKEDDAAIDAWMGAGALAHGRAAFEEAISHLRQARALLAARQNDPRALDVEQHLGGILVAARGWAHDETRAAWEAAAALCDPRKEPLRAGAIACGLGDVYSSLDMHKSLAQFEALVQAGEQGGLPLLTVAGHQGAAIPLRYLGRYAEARAHLDAGLAIYDSERHHFRESGFHEDKGISLLCWSAWLHWDIGALDRARRDASRAIALAERTGNHFGLAFAGAWAAIVETWSRNWPRAIELGERAAILAAEQGFVLLEAMARFAELAARGAQGMVEAPARYMAEIQRLAATGNRIGGAEVFAVLATMLLDLGQVEHALGALETGLGLSAGMQHPWCDAWLLTLKARCLLLQGQSEPGEALLVRALEIARGQGARFYELRAATALAAHWRERGRSREGAGALRAALGHFDRDLESAELIAARTLLALLNE